MLPSHQAAQARRCNALPAQSSAPSPPAENTTHFVSGFPSMRVFIPSLCWQNDRLVINCGQKGDFRTACRPHLQCMSRTLLHACTTYRTVHTRVCWQRLKHTIQTRTNSRKQTSKCVWDVFWDVNTGSRNKTQSARTLLTLRGQQRLELKRSCLQRSLVCRFRRVQLVVEH